MAQEISTYVHIPFCEHICYYCNFNKVFLDGQPVDEYVAAVLAEAKMWQQQEPATKIPTLYIGGGTPTSLTAKQLAPLRI